MRYLYLDTETTGTDPEDRLCQLAFSIGAFSFSSFYKPPVPIKIVAMSVSHITNEMVADALIFKDSLTRMALQSHLDQEDVCLVAHNAKFDIGILEKEGVKVPRFICTMKLARFIDDEGKLEKTNLSYLRYFYGIKIEATAHDAAGDVAVLEKVFNELFVAMTKKTGLIGPELIAMMIDVSSKPSLLRKMPFGKHKDMPVGDVPPDYISWLSKQPDLDEDLKYTLDFYLNERNKIPF